MKLIIDIPEEAYRARQHWVANSKRTIDKVDIAIANGTPIAEGDLIMFRTLMTEIANKGLPFEEVLLLIDNAKTPYNPTGDCISREALKRAACVKFYTSPYYKHILDLIDNAPTVPLPNEQIAWEQGYEAGLAQGKQDRPKGEWIVDEDDDIFKFKKCSNCGEVAEWLDGGSQFLSNFCPNCGADMRKGGAE